MSDWQAELGKIFTDIEQHRQELAELARRRQRQEQERADRTVGQRLGAERFARDVIEPLLRDIAAELGKHGRRASVGGDGLTRWIEVAVESGGVFRYELILEPQPAYVVLRRHNSAIARFPDETPGTHQLVLRKSIAVATAEDITRDFVQEYREYLWVAHFGAPSPL
ncbi:MAG: hypothetical protein M1376_10870 [Planctomycetes bacterium]|nr:hypothetical protein [Planctomycetota bacterium]